MKKEFFFLGAALSVVIFFGCRKSSTEEEFIAANVPVAKKYINHFQVFSDDNKFDNATYTVNYDSDGRVSSVTDGNTSGFNQYNGSNELSSVSTDRTAFNMSELYQAPYSAF